MRQKLGAAVQVMACQTVEWAVEELFGFLNLLGIA